MRDRRNLIGRGTIDPNSSARVEADHYLTATTPAQQDAVDAVIAEAQTELHAKASTPVVLIGHTQRKRVCSEYPRPVSNAGLGRAGSCAAAFLERVRD